VKFTTIYHDSLHKIGLNVDLMFCVSLNLHYEGEMKRSNFSNFFFLNLSFVSAFVSVSLFLFNAAVLSSFTLQMF